MSDLISRKDAIDVLAYFDEKDPLGHTPQQIIMALPPVQPQISGNAVNLCETCKYDFPECPKDSNVIFGDGKGSDNVCACSAYEVYTVPISKREWYQKGYEAGVKSVQPQRWIPVTEELPDDGVEVWVTIKGHDVIRCEEGETLEQAIDRINKIRWVTRGYWSEEEHGWNDPSFGCPLIVQPIAWMPIDTPEPWRGGQDEND